MTYRTDPLLAEIRRLAARCPSSALAIKALELCDEFEVQREQNFRLEEIVHTGAKEGEGR